MVLDQDDVDRQPLLDRGDDLRRHHQVGAVPDQRPHGRVRGGLLDADPGRDLVAHAGVAVLQVVLARRAGPPQLVQVARERTGRVDHHVVVADDRVQRAQHLGLRRYGARVVGTVGGLDDRVPALLAGAVLGLVRRVHPVVRKRLRKGREPCPGVADQGARGQLVRVEAGDVEVQEAYVGVLEERAGGGGEVGVPRAHADHQVGRAGEVVADRGAGVADAAEVGRVVVPQRALAGLGGRDRDAGGLDDCLQRRLGLAVVDAAARDDQRTPGGPDRLDGRGQLDRVGRGAAYVPDALGEELLRPVVGLRLHVLGEGQRDRAGLGRVGEHAHGVQRGRDQGLGAGDPVEVLRHGAQGVVDRHVRLGRVLQLLEQRVRGV